MAINNPHLQFECRTCYAAWSSGYWTWGCEECGGGAMQMPCEQCLGRCDAVMHRAAMDSNDSGRAHFFGSCSAPGEMKERAATAMLFEEATHKVEVPRLALRCELCDWSSDDAWREQPRGPQTLRVMLDAIEERGFRASARVLAHSLFGNVRPRPSLARLNLEGYWRSAGTLVVLEPTQEAPGPGQASPVRLCRVHRVISHSHGWVTRREAGTELPCADPHSLRLGHRYVALIGPTQMVPGMLIHDALDTEGREPELIDLHRLLIARGEET